MLFNFFQGLRRINNGIPLWIFLHPLVICGTHTLEEIGLLLLEAIQRQVVRQPLPCNFDRDVEQQGLVWLQIFVYPAL